MRKLLLFCAVELLAFALCPLVAKGIFRLTAKDAVVVLITTALAIAIVFAVWSCKHCPSLEKGRRYCYWHLRKLWRNIALTVASGSLAFYLGRYHWGIAGILPIFFSILVLALCLVYQADSSIKAVEAAKDYYASQAKFYSYLSEH